MRNDTEGLRFLWARIILQLIGFIGFIGMWGLGSMIANSPSVLPGPIDTFRAAIGLILDGYGLDLGVTAIRAISGWLLSLLIGVPIGILLGLQRVLHTTAIGVIDFLRNLPAFMFASVCVGLSMTGEFSRISIIAFASTLIVIHQCSQAVRRMQPARMDIIHAYRGSLWFIASRVAFFEALATGVLPVVRTVVGISFLLSIVVEMLLIPQHGIGARLLISMTSLELPAAYGFILLVGCIGWLVNKMVETAAHKLIYWSP